MRSLVLRLREIAVATRQWAALNPAATMRGPLSIDDVLQEMRRREGISGVDEKKARTAK